MPLPFFTVGHSTRALPQFLALLAESAIGIVADVRRFPGSRTNPQFSQPALAASLDSVGIGYRHFRELGGRRSAQPDVPPETNALWRERAFHNYADYALGAEFRTACDDLRALGRDRPCAVMCAEAVWWRCHRRIIADHLIAAGERVLHILGEGHVDNATLTPGARIGPGGVVTYPPEDLPGLLATGDAPEARR